MAVVFRANPLRGSSHAVYLARPEFRGETKHSEWFGRGAAARDLVGPVQPEAFKRELLGVDHRTHEPLVQNAYSPSRQSGYEIVFTAPSTVSTYWALAPAHIRKELEEAVNAATRSVLQFIEENFIFSCRGHGRGAPERAYMTATFHCHYTSRAGDPHLHNHAVILNTAQRSDGTTGSIVSNVLHDNRELIQNVYLAQLATELTDRLAPRYELTEHGFELADVPKTVAKLFSKRTEQIKEQLPEGADANTRRIVAMRTREEKTNEHTLEEKLADWATQAEVTGWGRQQAAELPNDFSLTPDEVAQVIRELNEWEQETRANRGRNKSRVNTRHRNAAGHPVRTYRNPYLDELAREHEAEDELRNTVPYMDPERPGRLIEEHELPRARPRAEEEPPGDYSSGKGMPVPTEWTREDTAQIPSGMFISKSEYMARIKTTRREALDPKSAKDLNPQEAEKINEILNLATERDGEPVKHHDIVDEAVKGLPRKLGKKARAQSEMPERTYWTNEEAAKIPTGMLVNEDEARDLIRNARKEAFSPNPRQLGPEEAERRNEILTAEASDTRHRLLKPIELHDSLDRSVQGVRGKRKVLEPSLIARPQVVLLGLLQRIVEAGGHVAWVEIHKPFEKAPSWNPLSELKLARLRVGRRSWKVIHHQLRLTENIKISARSIHPFSKAPEWSPLHKITLPAIQITHEPMP